MIRAFIAIEVEDRSVLSRIIEVWDRILGLGIDAKALAIYMVIHNHGFGADCLVGAEIASPIQGRG